MQNNIGPILMIAFTNHALDHMLHSILDANITKRIVRLGSSHSTDETMQQFSLDNLESIAGKSRLDRSFSQHHRALRDIQEQLMALMKKWSERTVPAEQIQNYLDTQYPEHSEHISYPPNWIHRIRELSGGDKWQHVGKNNRKQDVEDDSVYAFWRYGGDLDFIHSMEVERLSAPQTQSVGAPQGSAYQNKYDTLDVDAVDDSNSDSEVPGSDIGDDEDDVEIQLESWQIQWTPNVDEIPSSTADSEYPDLDIGDENDGKVRMRTQENPWALLGTSNVSTSAISALPASIRLNLPSPHHDLLIEETKLPDSIGPSDFRNLDEFLQAFGYEGPARTPSSDRPLDILLTEGLMWSLSLKERERLHTYWKERVQLWQLESQLQVCCSRPYIPLQREYRLSGRISKTCVKSMKKH